MNKHITITPGIVGGKPRIKGHRITVQNIAIWHERMGISVDEISAEYGLSLAEIYAALSYYFDHQDEINKRIREDEAFVEEMRKRNDSVLARKLNWPRSALSKVLYGGERCSSPLQPLTRRHPCSREPIC